MDVALRYRPLDTRLQLLQAQKGQHQGTAASVSLGSGGISAMSMSEAQQKACSTVVFDQNATQEHVASILVEPHLHRLIHEPGSAFVCSAYGQTGSGKTHSIFGPPGQLSDDALNDSSISIPEAWGVFPRSLAMLLQELNAAGASKVHAQMRVTAVEVYLEKVYDLLNDREPLAIAGTSAKATSKRMNNSTVTRDTSGKWVPPDTWKTVNDIREERKAARGEGNISLSGFAAAKGQGLLEQNTVNAKEMALTSIHDIAHAARTIEATRSAKSHSLNERSSRSHCLITITLQQVKKGMLYISHFMFADLAGSERITDSGVDMDGGGGAKAYALTNGIRVDLGGTRLDEARSVNTSLSALGRVVAAMSRNDKFISFRDSSLTQLLKPALTKPSLCRITVLLALRSESQYAAESVSTQRFGAVCANAANGGRSGPNASASGDRLPSLPSKIKATTQGYPARLSRLRDSDSNSSGNSSTGIKLSSALAEVRSKLTEADIDIQRMQEVGFEEHPAKPCSAFSASTIRSFLENKRKFDEGAIEVRKWKQALLELRAQQKNGNGCGGGGVGDRTNEIKHAEQQLTAAEHAVFVYSGMFYRQASTGIWIPRHKRLQSRMNDRERLCMQIEFLTAESEGKET